MSAVLDQPVRQVSPALEGEQRMLISDVSWDFYLTFCEAIGERPLRLSYNDGDLEITITKAPHEFYKKMLAKIVETTIMELKLPVRSGGSITFQVKGLEKGFEPDEYWWIEQEEAVRRQADFEFPGDPPPDLAIEIEIRRSLVSRTEATKIGTPVWLFRFFKLPISNSICGSMTHGMKQLGSGIFVIGCVGYFDNRKILEFRITGQLDD